MNQRITADPKSFKFKSSIADNANNAGISNVKIAITLAQVKASDNSENLLNEIWQIVCSLNQSKEITKKVYNNIIKSIQI